MCHSSCTCRSAAAGAATLAPVLELPCQLSLFQPLLNTSMAEENVPVKKGGVKGGAGRVGGDQGREMRAACAQSCGDGCRKAHQRAARGPYHGRTTTSLHPPLSMRVR